MKAGHAHEESAIIAVLIIGLIIVVDVFFDILDGQPGKAICYPILFLLIYAVVRFFRSKVWR